MPRSDVYFAYPERPPYEFDDPSGRMLVIDGVLRLKRVDDTGAWDPGGSFVTGQATVHTWAPGALTELTGFWAAQSDVDGTSVGFRLSADGGTTELYWDGAAWVAAGALWNTEAEVDAGIAAFPFAGSITFVVRLESVDGVRTPWLEAFYVFYEAGYDPTEDLLRSVVGKLAAEVTTPTEVRFEAEFPESAIPLGVQPWDVAEPIQVFNLTTDPNRQTDLFASFDGETITLSSDQLGELAVHYRGTLNRSRIHVSSDADMVQLQEGPRVVVMLTTQERLRREHEPMFDEQLRSKGVVRRRPKFAHHVYTLRVQAESQFGLHDKKLADAVRRAFDTREWVQSLALDEQFRLVGLELVAQTQQQSDQIFMRTVEVRVAVLEWLPEYVDVPMVLEIHNRARLPGGSIAADDLVV